MGKCIHHPERETNSLCAKHQIYLCEACLRCRDPELYCRFRSACPIWFMDKRGGREIDRAPQSREKDLGGATVCNSSPGIDILAEVFRQPKLLEDPGNEMGNQLSGKG